MDENSQLREVFLSASLPVNNIAARRQVIAERVISDSEILRTPDFKAIGRRELFEMLRGYDEQFFGGVLQQGFESKSRRLRLRLSKRMTSTGGLTSFHREVIDGRQVDCFEIAVSSTLLFSSSFSGRPVRVAGVVAEHRLDALQRIFEHELIHLAEMMVWHDSSCARPRFRRTVWNLFGHRESNHQLISPADQARQEQALGIGDQVEFSYRGQQLNGYINRIHRRATVLVKSSEGDLYEDGGRYARFYIPLSQLVRSPGS